MVASLVKQKAKSKKAQKQISTRNLKKFLGNLVEKILFKSSQIKSNQNYANHRKYKIFE